MDRSGTLGLCRYGMARASNTTGLVVRHTVNSRAAAARDRRLAVATAEAAAVDDAADAGGGAAVAAVATVEAVAVDGDPAGHRAWWPPTFAVVLVIRSVLVVDRATDDRSIRGSTSAVHRPAGTVVRPAAVYGERVYDGTASCGYDENSRAGGAGRRDTRKGWPVPANSVLAPVTRPADIGDWRTLAAMGSTTEVAVDGTGPVAGTGIPSAVVAGA